jgi:hypothetical protein
MVRRSTFNRGGESSILSSSTKARVLPASSSGLGSLTFNQRTGVRFYSPVPIARTASVRNARFSICPVRPMDQDRTLRNVQIRVRVLSGIPSFAEWWPSGKGASLSMRTRWIRLPSTSPNFDDVGKLAKPPHSQSGDRGFESLRRRHLTGE